MLSLAAAGLVALASPVAAGARPSHGAAASVGAPRPGALLPLVLPLRARLGGLQALAFAVSTPGSPEYGRYRSIAWLARRFGAPAAAERRVIAYLRGQGASHVRLDATGLFVDATLRAETAQRLFDTTLAEFHSRRLAFTAPSAPVSLPRALRGLVTGVVGLDTRPLAGGELTRAARAPRSAAVPASSADSAASGTQAGCAAARDTRAFTPNQYLTAYGYSALQAAGLDGEGERVALIEIDGFRAADIRAFARCFALRAPHVVSFGVGIRRPLPPGGETTLDLEVMTAAAPALKQIDVYESSSAEANSLEALTAPLQNPGYKPQVISASLGLCEPEVDASVGPSGLGDAEAALEEAAASGISFLDSSGDTGSAACLDSDGAIIPRLAVNYPASSWWVTGVGGTNFTLTPSNVLSAQVVWNDGARQPGAAGGGGQSSFRRPPFQWGIVSPDHREVPDVSMLADVYPGYAIECSVQKECVTRGQPGPWQGVGGTSAAAPLLAGGFALVDQDLREHGRQALGFANPLLYRLGAGAQSASVFDDVTSGGNDVGPFLSPAAPLGCCGATLGYDDASGWGSVILPGLAAAALAAQPPVVKVSLALPGGQHPVRAGGLRVRVGCDEGCRLAAFALVRIGRGRDRRLRSRYATLRVAGRRTMLIAFDRAEEARLTAALRRHARITASVFGASVDPLGNVETKSPTREMILRG